MILWGRATSVNVQKVLWGLEELGLSYDHRIVGGKYGGLDDPEFTKLTPVARVPVLQDGDLALWESHVILRYLARKTGRLGANDSTVDMWMEFGATTLHPPFIGLFWQNVRMTEAERDPKTLAAHVKNVGAALMILEAGMMDGRDHIAGDAFSMADVALGSILYRLTDLYPDLLSPLPNVTAWRDRVSARPAYQKWIATSYEELRATS